MDKIPFSVYDFFGLLSSGTVILAGVWFAHKGVDAFQQELNVAQGLVLVLAAYLLGHVVASVSSFLLERRLTRGFIGSPTDLLFGKFPPAGWRRLFSEYHKPLPEATAERVLRRANQKAGIDEAGEALFYHCFGVVRREEFPRERLASFLNLYGFGRNTSMAAFISAVIIGIAATINNRVESDELWFGALLAVFVGVVMFFRYLKFYRQYSVELYITYAEVM